MTDKVKNYICSISFLLFGIFMYTQALAVKTVMARDLGSGFMPKLIALAIIITAAASLIMTFINKKPAKQDASDTDAKGGLLTIACIAAYVVLYDIIGFLVSTFLYLFFQILILSNEQNRRLPFFALIAVVTAIIVYALFVYVIGMPLPVGILGF